MQIGSHVGPLELDAPELLPFFEAAADLYARVALAFLDRPEGDFRR